jgi:hypothetical protein
LVPLKTNPLQLESSRSNDKEEGNLFSICSHISTHASGDIDHMKCHWSIIFIQLKQKNLLKPKGFFTFLKALWKFVILRKYPLIRISLLQGQPIPEYK